MADNVNWEKILRDRYSTFKAEEKAYVDSLEICNSTDISIEKIYETIKNNEDIPTNLKLMYRKAIFGQDKTVKTRIKNRIGNIRHNVRYVEIYTFSNGFKKGCYCFRLSNLINKF